MSKRVAELEAENRALREFVEADDAYVHYCRTTRVGDVGGIEQYTARREELGNARDDARKRLADEFGIALPGGAK